MMEVLGASFEELSNSELKKLGLKNGVKVADLRSGKFISAGIKKGFIVTEINGTTINKIEVIEKVISGTKGGVYIEGRYPNGQAAYYAFGLQKYNNSVHIIFIVQRGRSQKLINSF